MDKQRMIEYRAAEAMRNPSTWERFEIDYGKNHRWLRFRHALAHGLAITGATFGGMMPPA